MKKILFVIPHMLAGGVETALLALLSQMDRKKYDISVLLVEQEGELLSQLPNDISVGRLPITETLSNEILHGKNTSSFVKKAVKSGNILLASQILYRKIINKDPLAKYSVPFSKVNALAEKYDAAICFHAHCPFVLKYVAEKVQSKKKFLWIHNDFKSTNFEINHYYKQLQVYDNIYCVSDQVRKEFLEIVPKASEKTSIFHNIIPKERIINYADEYYPPEYSKQCGIPIILSIGRLNHQKGFDVAVRVSQRLIDCGIEHCWYILGDGEDREKLQALIQAQSLNNTFILLGTRENPYPYIKNCNLYVQPSRHEGYGIAVAEARILEKPIICTNFAGAHEQIVNDINGLIVEFDEQQIFDAIKMVLSDRSRQERMAESLHQENQNAKCNSELRGFLDLIDEIS